MSIPTFTITMKGSKFHWGGDNRVKRGARINIQKNDRRAKMWTIIEELLSNGKVQIPYNSHHVQFNKQIIKMALE